MLEKKIVQKKLRYETPPSQRSSKNDSENEGKPPNAAVNESQITV